MKIKESTRQKYEWFRKCANGESKRLEHIAYSPEGMSAIECFHSLESVGVLPPTRERDELALYLNGKAVHGMTVAMVAEDFVGRVTFSKDIKDGYPAWVQNEIFQQAEKIARKQIGFIPSFIRNRLDFSEVEDLPQISA